VNLEAGKHLVGRQQARATRTGRRPAAAAADTRRHCRPATTVTVNYVVDAISNLAVAVVVGTARPQSPAANQS